MRNLNSKPVRELGVADEPKHLLSQLSNIEGTCALMTLEEAKINEADVIAMGTHGHTVCDGIGRESKVKPRFLRTQ